MSRAPDTTRTGRSTATAARVAAGLSVTLLLAVGCSRSGSTGGSTYTIDPPRASVQVDSPALQRARAASGIAPCPAGLNRGDAGPGALPAVTLPCLGGGHDVNLAALGQGRPAVVNFWSQTCGPCREESPLLQQLHEAAGSRLTVAGVDWMDPRPAYAIAFARQLGLTYPQLADPGGATRVPLRISGLPITVFVSASGRVVHTQYGAMASTGQVDGLVRRYLGISPAAGPTAGSKPDTPAGGSR